MTLPIIERLAQFQDKIQRLQNVDDEQIKAKLDEVNRILNEAGDESDSDEHKQEQSFELKARKVSNTLKIQPNQAGNKSGEPPKSYLQKIVEQRNLYLMKGK